MNKKGVSAIVATVLIILIIVAAVAILWVVIMPLIKYYLAFETACMKATHSIEISDLYKEIEYLNFSKIQIVNGQAVIKNGLNITLGIQIHRTGNEEFNLDDLQLLGEASNGDTLSIMVRDSYGKENLPNKNEKKQYKIKLLDNNALLLLTVSSIKVAPVIRIGKRTKICDIADEQDIFFNQKTYDNFPDLKIQIKKAENFLRNYEQ